mmetsp:Transcript_18265/g.22387  ORF Transcript_18265/g.22387 Transcript_18265/m.22387 type:complete len:426 (+) Transcript_18265:727-2004(+)|eukprot:CAMPEP_0204826748 /NCGR_PEP_ID=MMETSP1346-20131115/4368_1 /ASSEMBLY_ACC=CAM_ASM_000771 /TAXON_ID=215587 /ORGANISM="Aplanochytrium stocchinoi, Strain GSBS06" /LENGTH=425 /DNA_ID=CAMNT_0051954895 /DNA_START=373 /DNA_END=1650 /DNA_ORIENTATION=+
MAQKNPLRMLAIFSDVNDKTLNKLLNEKSDVMSLVNIPKGTIIYEEGEEATWLYFMYTGRVVLTLEDENGLVVELTRLQQLGSSFGNEMLVQKGAKYDSTACTLEDSVVIKLAGNKFEKLKSLVPKVAAQLQRISQDRATIKTISERIPTFRNMSEQKQHQMSVISQFVKFSPGDVIFTQNSSVQDGNSERPSFYIVTKGTVEVVINGKKVKDINAGDYFGEVGLVSNKPHSATIRVSDKGEEVYCLMIGNSDFKELFVDAPTVLAEFTLRAFGEDVDFQDFIKVPKARESFLEYCETEFAGENIDYLTAVEKLERINKKRMRKSVLRSLNVSIEGMKSMKKKLCEKQAKYIMENWVLDDSPHPVSMEGRIQQTLIERYKKNDFSFDMFEPSKELVYSILETDNFERYKKKPEFKEVLRTIGEYR